MNFEMLCVVSASFQQFANLHWANTQYQEWATVSLLKGTLPLRNTGMGYDKAVISSSIKEVKLQDVRHVNQGHFQVPLYQGLLLTCFG